MEKSLKRKIPQCSCIPDDIVWDILSRLPPKSLIKFRNVSKSWYHQIAHQDFIHKQMSTYGQICSETEKEDCIPFRYDFPRPFIMGSCDDLCCCMGPLRIFLYNPCIRRAVDLPRDTLTCYELWRYGFGLCYEESTQDFKVVKIESKEDGSISFAIYSLNEKLWGRKNKVSLQGLGRLRFYMPSICVKGIIYWCCSMTILSFDLSRQAFRQIPCPDVRGLDIGTCCFSVFKESVCFVERIGVESKVLSLWTLKDDGIRMQWKRRSHNYSDGGIRIPLGVSLQGKCFVTKTEVKEFGEVMLYDLETKEEEYFCRISRPTLVRNLIGMRRMSLHLLNPEGEYLFID